MAVALVASAGVGFAVGLAQPDPVQPTGTGWFDRWASAAADEAWAEGAASMAGYQLSSRGKAALGASKGSLAGVPFGTPGSTNLLHVVTLVGNELEQHGE